MLGLCAGYARPFEPLFRGGVTENVQKVKVIPNAFQLRDNDYPDMTALCNVSVLLKTDYLRKGCKGCITKNHEL